MIPIYKFYANLQITNEIIRIFVDSHLFVDLYHVERRAVARCDSGERVSNT